MYSGEKRYNFYIVITSVIYMMTPNTQMGMRKDSLNDKFIELYHMTVLQIRTFLRGINALLGPRQ